MTRQNKVKKKTLSRANEIKKISSRVACLSLRSVWVSHTHTHSGKNEILKFNVLLCCLIWRLNGKQPDELHAFSYFNRTDKRKGELLLLRQAFAFPSRKYLDLLTHHFFSDYVIVQLFSFFMYERCPFHAHTNNRPLFMHCVRILIVVSVVFSVCTIFLSYKTLGVLGDEGLRQILLKQQRGRAIFDLCGLFIESETKTLY